MYWGGGVVGRCLLRSLCGAVNLQLVEILSITQLHGKWVCCDIPKVDLLDLAEGGKNGAEKCQYYSF